MFSVKYLENKQIKEMKFDDYETAKSWAITTKSIDNVKWLIRDLETGNVFLGDTIHTVLNKHTPSKGYDKLQGES